MEEKGSMEFAKFVLGSDEDFYEEFLSELTDEEMSKFLEENSDFLKN